ncbi:transposase, partial [Limosilactobacillus fermentum]
MPDYPSNISRAQFALIQPDLENFRKHTRPRRYDLYDVFNAILYSLTIGCQWRELPHDFPEWHTVYRYYDMWRDKPDPTADSLLERLLINISRKSRDFSHGMDRPLLSPFMGLFV